MTDKDAGFLSGWSRRKLAAKRQSAASEVSEQPAVPDLEDAAAVALDPVVDADSEALIAALPSLDQITADFDMKPFLAKGIPASLKNAALRKLWSVSPSVRDYSDPAVDYAWDWNAPGGVPGGGGLLSEKSVAKMVKDLIGGKTEPAEDLVPDASDLTNSQIGSAAPEAEDEVAAEPPEVASVRRSNPTKVQHTQHAERFVAEEKTVERAERHAALSPGRRHGGALPE
jgi:hypothetical protein